VAQEFLSDGPRSKRSLLLHHRNCWEEWTGLEEKIRGGKGGPRKPPEYQEDFIRGMEDNARERAAHVAGRIPLRAGERVLDLGGGPGTYSIALVQQTPGLRSTVLDLPGVLEITREIVEQHGCADRVALMPGNYLMSSFGSGYDAVLLSGMMHRETADTCRRLLRKAFDALEPGGLVVVSDVFFESDKKNTPPFAIYFALNMMLTSKEGSAHAKTEMVRWATEAGFHGVELRNLPPPNPHTLVVGTKP